MNDGKVDLGWIFAAFWCGAAFMAILMRAFA